MCSTMKPIIRPENKVLLQVLFSNALSEALVIYSLRQSSFKTSTLISNYLSLTNGFHDNQHCFKQGFHRCSVNPLLQTSQVRRQMRAYLLS